MSWAERLEYVPFGAQTVSSGVFAAVNPWRFSSEYVEDDTATVYYNYRHYEPVTGRWMRRDPIGELKEWLDSTVIEKKTIENALISLSSFLKNDPVNGFDSDGLAVHIPLAAAGCLAGAAAIATNTVELKGCDLICGEYDGQSSTLCDILSAMLTAAVSCAASIENPFSALVGDTAAFITAEGFTHFASDFLGFDVTQYCNLFSH